MNAKRLWRHILCAGAILFGLVLIAHQHGRPVPTRQGLRRSPGASGPPIAVMMSGTEVAALPTSALSDAGTVACSFDADGPELAPAAPSDASSLRIRLEGINGRTVEKATPRLEGDRMVYDRGVAREVYVRRLEGMEQVFEFHAPVDEIRITGRFETEWKAERHFGRGVVFSGPAGEVLEYGEGTAVDAGGRRAQVALALDGPRWTLTVDRPFLEGARFPVVVDPLIQIASEAMQSKTAEALTRAVSFDLDSSLVAQLRDAVTRGQESDDFALAWPTPAGPVRMRGLLARQFTEEATIVIHRADGDEVVSAPNDMVFLASPEEGGSAIRLAAHVTLDGVQAHLLTADTAYRQDLDFAVRRGLHVEQSLAEDPFDVHCAVSASAGTSTRALSSAPLSSSATVDASVALVLDYAFYRRVATYYGLRNTDPRACSAAARRLVDLGLLLRVYPLFWMELGIRLRLSKMVLYTTPDPYNSDLDTFVEDFDTRADGAGVVRSVAMLITEGTIWHKGQEWGGYAREISVAGDHANAYAIARGYVNSPALATMTWAHELGHIFGSAHTFEYKPPIDECSIMSYCDNKRFTFGPRVIERIRSSVQQAFAAQCAGRRNLEGMKGRAAGYLTAGAPLRGIRERDGGRPDIRILDIPSGTRFLRIQASGGQGMYALAACRHLSPVPSGYEYQAAVLEDCQELHVAAPAPGRWFVALYNPAGSSGSGPSFSGVTLEATLLSDPPPLANAQGVFIRRLKQGMSLYYRVDLPSGGRDLRVSTTGPGLGGDPRLWLWWDLSVLAAQPVPAPVESGGNDFRYAVPPPGTIGGTWYARLTAAAEFQQVYIEALYTPDLTTTSATEVFAPLSSPRHSLSRAFRIVRPPGNYNRLSITVSGGRHQGFEACLVVGNPGVWPEWSPDWLRNPLRDGTVPPEGSLELTVDDPQLRPYYYVELVGTTSSEDRTYPPYFDVRLQAIWSRR